MTINQTGDTDMTIERYEYCPGNGTRYCLLFGELAEGRYLLAWLMNGDSGGSCVTFGSGIEEGYLMEKMRIGDGCLHLVDAQPLNRTDANAILGFLKLMGVDAWVSHEFTDLGLRPGDTPRYSMENPPRPVQA
ncbi:MAG: hypothetical protein QGG40_13350 [Myxococcota bacterium]|jgi:hypothetical protein|nr:hypothetical protein [Myxococcota bacterium]